MFYVFPITIPANTPATAKTKTTLKLTAGRITRVMLEFPAGHVGLTHIHVNSGLHQLYPTNPDANFSSSNETIDFAEDLSMDIPPFTLQAYAWNLDDTYEHTITLRIELESLKAGRSLAEEVAALLMPVEEVPAG